MRAVPLKSVIVATAALAGVPIAKLTAAQRTQLVVHIGEALRQSWEYFPWPQCEKVERRFWAPEFDADKDDYAEGDLVRVVTDEDGDDEEILYYRALQDAPLPNEEDLPQTETMDVTTIDAPMTIRGVTYTGSDASHTFYGQFFKDTGTDAFAFALYSDSGHTQQIGLVSLDSVPNEIDFEFTGIAGMGDLTAFAGHVEGFDDMPNNATTDFVLTRTVSAPTWEETTDFDTYVLLEETGETAMGLVTEAHDGDPLNEVVANEVRFRLLDDRVTFRPGAPLSVWLTFQRVPSVLDGTPWATGETIALGDVRYDATAGNCYRALAAISGVSNTTRPAQTLASWELMPVPAHLASAAKYLASAEYLREDGQEDKAVAREKRGFNELSQAIENVTMHQRQAGRIRQRR